ncbi:hypothetical protein IW262DRAFT_435171 [Armillaria fumosa]|nr:hypothetical protein IW262DRAFT_435171 [Armillaria fumosa]
MFLRSLRTLLLAFIIRDLREVAKWVTARTCCTSLFHLLQTVDSLIRKFATFCHITWSQAHACFINRSINWRRAFTSLDFSLHFCRKYLRRRRHSISASHRRSVPSIHGVTKRLLPHLTLVCECAPAQNAEIALRSNRGLEEKLALADMILTDHPDLGFHQRSVLQESLIYNASPSRVSHKWISQDLYVLLNSHKWISQHYLSQGLAKESGR